MKLGRGIAAVIVLASAGAGLLYFLLRQPESTAAMRGQQLATTLGCFGCHGTEGRGGVADPTSPAGQIPGWDGTTAELFIRSEQEIREWILHGAPRRLSAAERSAAAGRLVPMPAYQDTLTEPETDDLVAYFLAVSGWAPDIPDAAFEGRIVARRLGCFGCHGPSGMGGIANPGSFVGHIPAWDGEEFAELVRDDRELRTWILEGRPRRLAENRLARFFLERQKTPMPPYREMISDVQLEQVIAYIHWLRRN